MRLSTKHANTQNVIYQDFTGGLNTTNAAETIDITELSTCVNLELNGNQLMTVSGTKAVTITGTDSGDIESMHLRFTSFFYDRINDKLVVCANAYDNNDVQTGKKIYVVNTDGSGFKALGPLTGTIMPSFAQWEDGVLIASGGKMQYYNGTAVVTLTESPEHCNGVFTKNGRVITYFGDEVHYSKIGDETSWAEDSNDDSSAKWLQIGYKDGGHIVSAVNLSQDLLIFKSNDTAYHVSGQYPDWTVREISRNVDCKGWRSSVALTNAAIVLGKSMVQAVTTTDDYGEMRATNISTKIEKDILKLPDNVKMRYVAPKNQVWFITGEKKFLFFDVSHQSYYHRAYNTPAVDVCYKGDKIFVLKSDAICFLDNDPAMRDAGNQLQWTFTGKTLVANNDYLIKRVKADITPYFQTYTDIRLYVGHVVLSELMPKEASQIYHDYSFIYHSRRPIKGKSIGVIYVNAVEVYDNDEEIYQSETPLKSIPYVRQDRRQVVRHKVVRVYGKGRGGRFVLNNLNFDIVEV